MLPILSTVLKEDCFRNDLTLWAHQVERIDKLIRLLQEIKEIK